MQDMMRIRQNIVEKIVVSIVNKFS